MFDPSKNKDGKDKRTLVSCVDELNQNRKRFEHFYALKTTSTVGSAGVSSLTSPDD